MCNMQHTGRSGIIKIWQVYQCGVWQFLDFDNAEIWDYPFQKILQPSYIRMSRSASNIWFERVLNIADNRCTAKLLFHQSLRCTVTTWWLDTDGVVTVVNSQRHCEWAANDWWNRSSCCLHLCCNLSRETPTPLTLLIQTKSQPWPQNS